jgi:hypothetical protein
MPHRNRASVARPLVSKIVRRKKPQDRTKAQVAALIADVEALKTASNEILARLAKVEVVKAGPQDPAAVETPPAEAELPFNEQKPETE